MALKWLTGSMSDVFVGMCRDTYAFLTNDAGGFNEAYAFAGKRVQHGNCGLCLTRRAARSAMTVGTARTPSLLALLRGTATNH